jgi:hypothetical protein
VDALTEPWRQIPQARLTPLLRAEVVVGEEKQCPQLTMLENIHQG